MSVRLRIVTVTLVLLVFARAALAQSVVAVLGALPAEVAPIEKRLQDSRETVVRGYVFRVGTLNGRQVVVGRSGAGKVNAAIITTLLINHFNPSVLFFSGTAGAVDQDLRLGDVVIGATVAQHDAGLQAPDGIRRQGSRNVVTGERDPLLVPAPDMLLAVARRSASSVALRPLKTGQGERVPRITEGVIVTGDVFMADVARRDELRKSLGATAVEMEGAAVVMTCRRFGVPCLVVRSISDSADMQASTTFDELLPMASENAAALVAAIIVGLDDGAR